MIAPRIRLWTGGTETAAPAAAAAKLRLLHVCTTGVTAGYMGPLASGAAMGRSYFHLPLVSDSTGRDLDRRVARGRAISGRRLDRARLPLVRTAPSSSGVVAKSTWPGIVLFTLVDPDLSRRLETACEESGLAVPVGARPVLTRFNPISARARRREPAPAHAQSRIFQADRRA